MEKLANLAKILILATVSTLVFGCIVSAIWGWYIVPAFAVGALKYKTAIGMGYIVNMMTAGLAAASVQEYQDLTTVQKYLAIFIVYGVLFCCAGFWHLVLP